MSDAPKNNPPKNEKPVEKPVSATALYGDAIPVRTLHFRDKVTIPGKSSPVMLVAGKQPNNDHYEIALYPRVRAFRIVHTPQYEHGRREVRMLPESWAAWEPVE